MPQHLWNDVAASSLKVKDSGESQTFGDRLESMIRDITLSEAPPDMPLPMVDERKSEIVKQAEEVEQKAVQNYLR
ncbi:unnamed protein product [Protopolystoma xenopodis]|uniref:Uncharacterized protein n=1 Tax=Protopolystoma xenopodis TaxID=117903 RepID=A0A448WMK9_9PLAT|nr:unnamed protein product [Protopolystoma xenopodis]